MTEVVALDPFAPDVAQIERAGALLCAGALVAFPTETVYGLGASIAKPAALGRIFEAKGRPRTDPLIVHVAHADGARAVVADWPAVADRLADAFWPGPLTLVLPRRAVVPAEVTAGGESVGVRVPAHPVALALISAAGVPIAAPSANRFGRVSPTDAGHVLDELAGRIELLLDAGATPLGIESTVVDLTSSPPRVLRHGGVTVDDLEAMIGPVVASDRAVVADDETASAPGQLLRHYAPKTPLVLVEGSPATVIELHDRLSGHGVRVGVVLLSDDGSAAARELYRQLRAGDSAGCGVLLARAVPPDGLGRAVNDRLFRAAHGRVVTDSSPTTVERLVRWAAG